MSMLKIRRGFALAVLATVALAGCQTMPGALNGLGIDPMSHVVVIKTRGVVTEADYALAEAAVNDCVVQTRPQLAGALNAAGAGAGAYGTGYGAAGAQSATVYVGMNVWKSFLYNSLFGLGGGAVNGLHSYSYNVDNIDGGCGELQLRDDEKDDEGKIIKSTFLHILASSTLTNNRRGKPSAGLIGR